MIKAIHNNVVLQKKVKQGQKGIYMPSMGDDSFIVLNVGPEAVSYTHLDHNGCQLVPELADKVIDEISKIDDMFHIQSEEFDSLVAKGLIKMIDEEVDNAYVARVKKIKINDVKKDNIKIVYTPLHGTGATHMVELLSSCGYHVYLSLIHILI